MVLVVALIALLIAGFFAGGAYGASRWARDMRALHARLQADSVAAPAGIYSEREIEGLPAPVQRYFRTVLKEGQPIVATVRVSHRGEFNMGDGRERWRPFTSQQCVTTHEPGFVWDGRIRMGPRVYAYARDVYMVGEGELHAKLLGLITLADQRGTPELASGELLRYLAEAVWYPTALLPSQGVRWERIDASNARATIEDRGVTASAQFSFTADGTVSSVWAPARHRAVKGLMVRTPWQAHFRHYERRAGIVIPVDGEVGWHMPEGYRPYWRGHLESISYQVAA